MTHRITTTKTVARILREKLHSVVWCQVRDELEAAETKMTVDACGEEVDDLAVVSALLNNMKPERIEG